MLMERLSVSLDQDSLNIIEQYLPKYQGSKADIIRRALQCLNDTENVRKKASLENIKAYVEYLANMEHVIVDIALWKAICNEIGRGTEEFWEEVYAIGQEHQKEYFDRGIKNIQNILEFLEKTNAFKLNIDSENSYTLILAVSESSKFIKTFLEGFFNNYPRKVEIAEEYKKIRVRVI